MTSNQDLKYKLDDQIGFILRRANQRHTGIFSDLMPDELTPTRFAALVRLLECGTLSQNQLGRLTAMDVATIKGVVDRLRERGLVESIRDRNDARRQSISLTERGRMAVLAAIPRATEVTEKTVSGLSETERDTLMALLAKIT